MIERYLSELRSRLPRGPLRRRILVEVEDHLREAAVEDGEEAAVRRFGPPGELAREFRPRYAVAASRLAAVAVLFLLVLPVLSYPIPENALPPAPWPEGEMPGHLAWKQDALGVLFLLALGAGLPAAFHLRRGGRALVVSLAAALVPLGAAAGLGVVLSLQWAAEVPGTPGWLVLVPVSNVALCIVAAALLARALRLRSAS